MKKFEIFKELTIGGTTKEQLHQQLISTGIQFNKYANMLFEHPQFSPIERPGNVKLVKIKLSDLEMNSPCSISEMIRRASVLGLKLCPLYLGAFLRLDYLEQPSGPYLTIASARPENDEDYPNGFYIRNYDDTLCLRGYRADDFCEWPSENEFIFLK